MSDEKEDLSSMVAILNKLSKEGYTAQFKVYECGITSMSTQKEYSFNEVAIDRFFRFEGDSNPDDNAIVYAISTDSAEKGTLVDSYGANSDPLIEKFIKEVESIQK
ncbi:MAG TPA: hypothetical protein VFG10_02940 [Saprospiraceae bacterium]|nr:hypothetical protein [Saprospiraceae bacterium]